jgi:uncharacterized membrane protein YeaQ/YmgE (transglycosylase-associated protein family)
LEAVVLALFLLLVFLFVVLPLFGMAFWAILSTIFVGLIIGALGRLVVPGYQAIGLIATVAAGLCGAVLGGFVGQHVFGLGHAATVLIEIGVAAAVVAVFAGGRRRHEHLVR